MIAILCCCSVMQQNREYQSRCVLRCTTESTTNAKVHLNPESDEPLNAQSVCSILVQLELHWNIIESGQNNLICPHSCNHVTISSWPCGEEGIYTIWEKMVSEQQQHGASSNKNCLLLMVFFKGYLSSHESTALVSTINAKTDLHFQSYVYVLRDQKCEHQTSKTQHFI